MEIKQISGVDFPALGNAVDFDLYNSALVQIYLFYKDNSQDFVYAFNPGTDIMEVLDVSAGSLYADYGIFFYKDEVVNMRARLRLLVVPDAVCGDMVSLNDFIKSSCEGSLASFTNCIIEHDFASSSSAEIKTIYNTIKSACPKISILNESFLGIDEIADGIPRKLAKMLEIREYSGELVYTAFDVSDIFAKYVITRDTGDNIENSLNIIKELRKVHRVNKIFYFGGVANNSVRFLYLSLAAYLTLSSGFKFYISQNDESKYLGIMRKGVSREYNFLSDYLQIITNIPNFTVSYHDNVPNLFVKDIGRLQAARNSGDYDKFGVTMTVQYAKVDLELRDLVDSVLSQPTRVLYESVEVLRFRDYFNLDSANSVLALSELKSLNTFVRVFDKLIRNNSSALGVSSLNSSNLLLFRKNGDTYVGYVTMIDGKVPFLAKPFSSNYKFVPMEVETRELPRLYDTRIFFDTDENLTPFLLQYPDFNQNKNYKLSSTFKGCLLQGYSTTPMMVRLDKGLCLSDIGIWSTQTSQLRTELLESLGKHLSVRALLEREYLTFFGGPHPSAISNSQAVVQMELTPEIWR